MTGASSSTAASTTARAISRLLTLKEGTANRFSKTYFRNDRGLVTNISFSRLNAHHRKVFRDLPVRLESGVKSAPSVVDLPFGFSGFNNQARSSRPFCGSPVEQPFDCRSTKPKGVPLPRHKAPGSRTIVCASYGHYRWRVRPDATQFFA